MGSKKKRYGLDSFDTGYYNIIHLMPQLIPFYFINQVTAAFVILSLMIYIFSVYSLPLTVRLFLSRIFIIKL